MKKMSDSVIQLVTDEIIPKMAVVQQLFPTEQIEKPVDEIRKCLDQPWVESKIKPGMSVAITAGSRGIDNIALIIKETVAFVKKCGAFPFVIPAMGSHGGATAEGQTAVLKDLGITEESIDCEIRSSMEVVPISALEDGTPVCIDRYASEADGIIVVNRIKPHTGFRGRYESGLIKMMAIGLGKQYGAQLVHGYGSSKLGESVEKFGREILHHANILFGLATIENAYDKSMLFACIPAEEIESEEPKLLEIARNYMARLLIDNLDVLVVDYIGKNISGSGMDPNITKTYLAESGMSKDGRAKRIIVLDLSDGALGAATGIGCADITTERFVEKMDINTTYPNSLTTGATESPRIPMFFPNQEIAIKAGIRVATGVDKEHLRMARIKNTLQISEIMVSETIYKEIKSDSRFRVIKEPDELVFDQNGDLFV